MRVSFPVPSSPVPVGGIAIIFEFATSLARCGHEVTLLHHELFGGDASSRLEDIGWFEFADDVELSHLFIPARPTDLSFLPSADVIFGFSPAFEADPRLGLPVVLIQGWRMYPEADEVESFLHPAPKVCVAEWLVDVGLELGVDRRELVHVPQGIHHERFRVTRSIVERDPRVTFCFNPHPRKGPNLAFDVLEEVHRLRPEVRLSAFGTRRPDRQLPEWLEFVESPSPDALVDEIYNGSSIFLCTSEVEGFGRTAIEAMACGAALVTTDNGGSRDYATHDRTALVSPPMERDPLVRHIIRLVDDDRERIRLSEAGGDHARSFTWSRSAEILEEFLSSYLAEPAAFGRVRRAS